MYFEGFFRFSFGDLVKSHFFRQKIAKNRNFTTARNFECLSFMLQFSDKFQIYGICREKLALSNGAKTKFLTFSNDELQRFKVCRKPSPRGVAVVADPKRATLTKVRGWT